VLLYCSYRNTSLFVSPYVHSFFHSQDAHSRHTSHSHLSSGSVLHPSSLRRSTSQCQHPSTIPLKPTIVSTIFYWALQFSPSSYSSPPIRCTASNSSHDSLACVVRCTACSDYSQNRLISRSADQPLSSFSVLIAASKARQGDSTIGFSDQLLSWDIVSTCTSPSTFIMLIPSLLSQSFHPREEKFSKYRTSQMSTPSKKH
jgi:hypothetical protein